MGEVEAAAEADLEHAARDSGQRLLALARDGFVLMATFSSRGSTQSS